MALVMTKYRYNDNNYLVYERTILDKSFTTEEWSTICDNNTGIDADFIIEIVNTQINIYNAYGEQSNINKEIQDIISYHEYKHNEISSKIKRTIEVRFTDNYINKLTKSSLNNMYIA